MSPASSVDKILEDIKENPKVNEVTLVSRSGTHIAGDVPKKAHRETYVAMSAILLGSAETATSELDDHLNYVLVDLDDSRILIQDGGPSAILVTRLTEDTDIEECVELTKQPIKDIQELL